MPGKGSRPVAAVVACVWLCAASNVPAAPPAPDPDFLEFLGEWRMDNGDWQDPLALNRSGGASPPARQSDPMTGPSDRRAAPDAARPHEPGSHTDRPADPPRSGDAGHTGAPRE